MFVSEVTTVPVPAGLLVQRLRTFFASPEPDVVASSALGQQELALRVGMGPVTRRVVVQGLAAYPRGSLTVFPFRWSVAGPTGSLFPVLDANLEVSPDAGAGEGDARCQLRIVGAYRPPLGSVGVVLDRVVLDRVAVLTVRHFVARLVSRLVPELLPGRDHEPDVEIGLEWGLPATS